MCIITRMEIEQWLSIEKPAADSLVDVEPDHHDGAP